MALFLASVSVVFFMSGRYSVGVGASFSVASSPVLSSFLGVSVILVFFLRPRFSGLSMNFSSWLS